MISEHSLFYNPPIQWFLDFVHDSNPDKRISVSERYQKQYFFNRCLILTSQGVQKLSIPVQKFHHQQLLTEIKIYNGETWQKKHWQAIQTAYNNSPFFEYFKMMIEPFYKKKYEFLYHFTLELLECLFDIFELETPIQITLEEKEKNAENSDFGKVKRTYYLKYQNVFEHKINYLEENITVLDYLFCVGKTKFDRS